MLARGEVILTGVQRSALCVFRVSGRGKGVNEIYSRSVPSLFCMSKLWSDLIVTQAVVCPHPVSLTGVPQISLLLFIILQ